MERPARIFDHLLEADAAVRHRNSRVDTHRLGNDLIAGPLHALRCRGIRIGDDSRGESAE